MPQVERAKGRLGELIDQCIVDDEEVIFGLDQLILVIDQLKVDAHNEELSQIGQFKVELKDGKMLIGENATRAFFWNRIEKSKNKG